MSRDKLKKLIKEKKGYITTEEAQSYGIHREYLSLFVKEDQLIRVSPGIYQSPNSWEDFLFQFQQKKKQLIYSHDTALYLHGLSDRDPIKYAVTLPSGYNTSQIKSDMITAYTIKKSLLDLGKTTLKTSYGNEIFVYDKERTICDIVRSRNRLDKQIVIDGLKKYVLDPNKDLNKLMKYAESLGVQNVMREYMEILL